MFITSFFSHLDTRALLANLIITAATVVVAVAAIIVTTRLAGPIPLSINQTTLDKGFAFDVRGEAEITAVPDEAVVTAGFTTSGKEVESTQEQANTVLANLTAAMKSLGIADEDLRTTDYSIFPEYDFSGRTQSITGYRVNGSLEITVKDLTLINQVIDTATAAGANQVGGVNFRLSQQQQATLREQARAEAIEEAKANARELTRLAGVDLGRIVNISEFSDSGQPPYFPMREMAFDQAASSRVETSLEPGSTTYRLSVVLSYELK